MDNLIEVDREIIKMQLIHDLPESDKKRIFIPAYSINYTHYYFLLDFKRCIIVCWSVNVEKLVNYFTSFIKDRNDIKVPWNKDFKSYMESIFFPHSVQSYRDKVIISFIGGNAFLELDIYNFSHKLIIDELNFGSSMMYSSTNEIYGDKMYFTRWNINENFLRCADRKNKVNLQIGYYDLVKNDFSIIDCIKEHDNIHGTYVVENGNKLLIVEMCQEPRYPYPTPPLPEEKAEMLKVLKSGLYSSDVILYDLETQSYDLKKMAEGPAHLEKHNGDSEYYLSTHNLSTNNNVNCCFGISKIHKINFKNNKINFMDCYESDDLLRASSHKCFDFNNLKLLAITVFPNQIHILDREKLDVYKKIELKKSNYSLSFSDGPMIYPRIDKTPYTVHVNDSSNFIFLSSLWNVVIYDFLNNKKIASIVYNTNKPLIAMGHAITI